MSAAGEPGSKNSTDSSVVEPNQTQICTVFYGRSNFIGRHLVTALLKSEIWSEIRVADPLPNQPVSVWSEKTPVYFQTDPSSSPSDLILSTVDGASVVFYVVPVHADTLVNDMDFRELYDLVVGGVKNVVAVCRYSGVKRIVFTGSADVVFDGIHSIDGADESLPYPEKFASVLNGLLAQAEKIILSTNGRNGMLTCALRPSCVFGPGDTNLVPFLVTKARSGCAKFVIGDGRNVCDFTYVENVVHANICAERALRSNTISVAGKPFLITNGEPVSTGDFLSSILEGLGYERPRIHVPVKLVLMVVLLLEWTHKKLGLHRAISWHVTSTLVHSLSCTRRFNSSRAEMLIGYSPIVSLEDGVLLTVKSFSDLTSEPRNLWRRDYSKPSRTEELLGCGKVAELLLWRDERKTFMFLVAIFPFCYWFLFSGRTLISASATLFLLASILLLVNGFLPSSMFGFNINKIPASCFHVSELTMRNLMTTLVHPWNSGMYMLNLLAKGDDWNLLFKVVVVLYMFKLLLSYTLSVLVGFGLVFLFIVFIVFEQYENELMKLMSVSATGIKKLQEMFLTKVESLLVTFSGTS